MVRKFIFLFLFSICLHSLTHAQIRDTVRITIPPYTDTSCVTTELQFAAHITSDTFTALSYKWFTDNGFNGITNDTFLSTALANNDSVYCKIYFVNSFGVQDSSQSNTIIIHHAAALAPRVLVGITEGSNPDCSGHPVTFAAYPIVGGNNPQYQWRINGMDLAGEDSVTITRYFGGADTVSCRMISDASCRTFDTAFSLPVPIIHVHYVLGGTISGRDTICYGRPDTFYTYPIGYASSIHYQWYVNTHPILGAFGPTYITDSLTNGSYVYCKFSSFDSCVVNPVFYSDTIHMYVGHDYGAFAEMLLTSGSNPGCLDSPTTFTAMIDSFGTSPFYEWILNGSVVSTGTPTYSGLFANLDQVQLFVRQTDGGCYTADSVLIPATVMIRDSTPTTPWISLIANLLVANSGGVFHWYYGHCPNGVLIPGATGPNYHPYTLGYYYCIRDSADCHSLCSNELYISLLKVENVDLMSGVSVYPNPTSGLLNIDWKTNVGKMQVDIYDVVGQSVLHEEVLNNSTYSTDLSNLPQGTYSVVLRSEDGLQGTYKVTVSH